MALRNSEIKSKLNSLTERARSNLLGLEARNFARGFLKQRKHYETILKPILTKKCWLGVKRLYESLSF